jgi:hypothetical protein
MITYAKSKFILLEHEFAKISRSFFTHRMKLNTILNSPSGIPFDESQCQIIWRYVKFVYEYIGSEFDNSVLFDRMKQTKTSARWVKDSDDSDSSEGNNLLGQVVKNIHAFDGFMQLLVDTAVSCWNSMLESMEGQPLVTYRFRAKLKSIVDSRDHDRNNVDPDVIDLTHGDEHIS